MSLLISVFRGGLAGVARCFDAGSELTIDENGAVQHSASEAESDSVIRFEEEETTMSVHRIAWFDLCANVVRLGVEAQAVIGLRIVKAAFGGPAAQTEARLMVAEKTQAALDAQLLLARSLFDGQGHLAPARTLSLYRRRVQANQRRLSRGG